MDLLTAMKNLEQNLKTHKEDPMVLIVQGWVLNAYLHTTEYDSDSQYMCTGGFRDVKKIDNTLPIN